MDTKYGLSLPSKLRRPGVAPIFDDSSSNEDQSQDSRVPQGPSRMELRKARCMQKQALTADPTIFLYDEHYDEPKEELKKEKEPLKPKYIAKLLRIAEKRKLESELRMERQMQKTLEVDSEQYKDKETFVTGAYRKRLDERKIMEEQERREAYLESIGDVTKQKNIDGFYRYLYEQKLGTDKTILDETGSKKIKNSDSDKLMGNAKGRNYRKRKTAQSDEESSPSPKRVTDLAGENMSAHLNNNLDVDSEFDINSSSEDDDEDQNKKCSLPENRETKEVWPTNIALELPFSTQNRDNLPLEKLNDMKLIIGNEVADVEADSKTDVGITAEKIVQAEAEELTKIWDKRTVGEVFDAAVNRFFERKASLGS